MLVNLVKLYHILEKRILFCWLIARQSRMSLEIWKAHQHFIANRHCRD